MKCECGGVLFDFDGSVRMQYFVVYDEDGKVEDVLHEERLSDKLKNGFFKCKECGKKTDFRVFVMDF